MGEEELKAAREIFSAARERSYSLDLRKRNLTTLPAQIGLATTLTILRLSGNQLATLPGEIGELAFVARFDVSNNRLIALPPQIGQLGRLVELNLRSNQLSTLPAEIGNLANLGSLDLSNNRLTSLPPEIKYLSDLQSLDLSNNRLSSLPPELGSLTNLRHLRLNGNQLTELPPEIGQLLNLPSLNIHDNQLTSLPPNIGDLTNLLTLDCGQNALISLPVDIGRLFRLKSLDLSDNGLTSLPTDFGTLTNLTALDLSNNQLATFPPEISQLRSLQELDLSDNQLVTLPPEIADLTELRVLDLRNNQLMALPPELGSLPETVALHLEGNRLREPLPTLLERGLAALFAYLRSLEGAEPQYEAKVLLVGEGNVGKTCLVAALRGEEFIDNLPTTHGIQVKTLPVAHPDLDVDVTLNTWDFGGQEVYRITHQFFFSRRSLYVLVWRPREGQEENAIEAWCKRIRLRVGEEARVIVVATHCDERSPELDYPELKRKFGNLLVGHYAVDNRSGKGIEALKKAIAVEAAQLPQIGELISQRWIAARDEILARPEPQIAHREFVEACKRHGLDDKETAAITSLLHDLGHIIYYGEDEGLRDVVVLQPEWLTKAIGYVLEDAPTRHAGGVLDHRRLKEIWQGSRGRVSYPAEYHPYFLRLMEKFDVSYRLPEEADASLVGQLVPYERPDLPWDNVHHSFGTRTLSLICRTSESAPGLVAWLTVRNHRFSTGQHWRRGVFLAHRAYASEALLELVGDRDLFLEVRAPSPDYLFNVLRDSVEDLIARRWPGLTYELLVPCSTVLDSGRHCPGQFKLRSLLKFREQSKPIIVCHECVKDQDVARLLTGFSMPNLPSSHQMEEVNERLGEVAAGIQRIEEYAADSANEIRAVMKVVSAEVVDCPTFFTLTAEKARGWERARIWEEQYRLTLWCEHSGAWHPWPAASYTIRRPRGWLEELAPFVLLVNRTLRLVVPIAGAVAGIIWSENDLKAAQNEMELTKALVEQFPSGSDEEYDVAIDSVGQTGLTRAQSRGLRALRILLVQELDPSRGFGDLRRVRTPSGDFLWVCERHYPEYDPGLPILPD